MATIKNIDPLVDSATVTSVTFAPQHFRHSRNYRQSSTKGQSSRRIRPSRAKFPERKLRKFTTAPKIFLKAQLQVGKYSGEFLAEAGELAFAENLGSVTIVGDLKLIGDLIIGAGTRVRVTGAIDVNHGVISGDGSIEAQSIKAIAIRLNGSLNVHEDIIVSREIYVLGSITVGDPESKDPLWMEAERSVFVGGDLDVFGGVYLPVIGDLEVHGDAKVELPIKTSGHVFIDGNVRCASLISEGKIEVGGSIFTEQDVRAARTISAGQSISAKWRIMAGIDEYSFPTPENSVIRCRELNGNIICGELELIP